MKRTILLMLLALVLGLGSAFLTFFYMSPQTLAILFVGGTLAFGCVLLGGGCSRIRG